MNHKDKGKIMVDKNDFLRNIFHIYSSDKLSYDNLYRYIGIKEFENIFEHNQIFFTNPRDWTSTDKYEVYFENWWINENNLKIVYKQLEENINKTYERYGVVSDNAQFCNSVFSNMVACMGILQQEAYCYCVANSYYDNKMVEAYYKKYGRNLIIKFKPYFFKSISILSEGKFVPSGNGFLCADVFPMVYVDSIEEFISSIAGQSVDPNITIATLLDQGAF